MICAGKEKLLGRHTSDFQQQFYLLGMSSLLRNMKCFVLLVECFVLLVEGIGGGNTPVYTHTHIWNVLCCWWNVLCCWWNVLRCWGDILCCWRNVLCCWWNVWCCWWKELGVATPAPATALPPLQGIQLAFGLIVFFSPTFSMLLMRNTSNTATIRLYPNIW